MDFFQAQARARLRSGFLLAAFLAAAVFVVASYCAMAAVLYTVVALYAGLPVRGGMPAEGSLPSIFLAALLRVPIEVPLLTAGAVLASIIVVSLHGIWRLSEGGPAVAHRLGARYLDPSNCVFVERKLLNVVEEMSIASGIAVPPVYVLDGEQAINTLVAGHSANDAVIVATGGAIAKLSRDELQGVMAHEYSHILSGDMAVNVRLVGLLAGISWVGNASEKMVEHALQRSRGLAPEQVGADAFAAVAGAVLALVGFPGALAADAIKGAFSRQREYLADASSVQFTRNPDAIAGALDTLLALHTGTIVHAACASEFSHMFFAQAVSRWWSFPTHPPILDRIQRAHPQFRRLEYRRRRGTDVSPSDRAVAVIDGGGNVVKVHDPMQAHQRGAKIPQALFAVSVAASVGRPAAEHIDYARALLARIPPTLRDRLASPDGAAQVLCALAIAPEESVRQHGLAALAARRGDAWAAEARDACPHVAKLGREYGLALTELALPALRGLKQALRDSFLADHRAVIESDRRITLREFVLHTFLRQHLREDAGRPLRSAFNSVAEVKADAHAVLSLVAHAAAGDAVAAAFAKGVPWLGVELAAALPMTELSTRRIGEALERLRLLQALEKPRILRACVDAAGADGTFRIAEAELVRIVAATLDCPLPPLIAALDPARLAK